jgi:hypothetical protein
VTAPASVRSHVDAVHTLLAANSVPAYRGEAPAGAITADPFVAFAVVYPNAGMPEGTLGDRHRDLSTEFTVIGVGRSAEQSQWVTDKARVALLTLLPAVPGRVSQPLWQVDGSPTRRNDAVSPAVFETPVVYVFRSGPP